jgi:hypothetical protein
MRKMNVIHALGAVFLLVGGTTAPVSAAPNIGVQWGQGDLMILAIGDLAPQAGLEFIGIDALGSKGVYQLGTGALIGPIPPELSNLDYEVSFTLRDLNGDGYAEIICLAVENLPYRTTVGLLEVNGSVQRVWPDFLLQQAIGSVEVMNLNAAEPRALVLAGLSVVIVSSTSGVILYDSATDPDIDQSYRVESVLVDDFDGDGRDELLVEMSNPMWPTTNLNVLIGDRDAVSSAGDAAIASFRLGQNWPNPLNPTTTISFELDRPGRIRLRIYDTAGRLVRTLADTSLPAGSHRRVWDGRDDGSRPTASGIYFYELDVDGRREARKMLQVR